MNAFLFALAMVQAPAGKPVHPGQKPSAASKGDAQPVTAREARETFVRIGDLLRKTNGQPMGIPSIAPADRPVTRAEVVSEMARLYKAAEPIFKFTPAPVPHDKSKFKIDPVAVPALDRLVTRGCVARIGPLAVGPQPGLTPKQFGDAVGFFTSRVSQMAHLPSAKWTPMLQKE